MNPNFKKEKRESNLKIMVRTRDSPKALHYTALEVKMNKAISWECTGNK